MIAPAAALRSMSSWTFDARRLGTTRRPTTPAGAITDMSVRSPSRVPRSMVSVLKSGVAAAPMISAAMVFSVT
jgi:hypothetical protein